MQNSNSMNLELFNKTEIERLQDFIELNDSNLEEQKNLKADIELIQTNPKQYWNSFIIPDNPTESQRPRISFIRAMQSIYNNNTQLTIL